MTIPFMKKGFCIKLLKISNKYPKTNDFTRFIIDKSKKELDKRSPYTFHYEPIKTGRKITGIRFVPIYQPHFEYEELKKQKLLKQMSTRWYIPKNIEDYLKYNFDFTEAELKNNIKLFEILYKKTSEEELLDFLVELRPMTLQVDNAKAYVIGALKKKNGQLFEEKYMNKK